MITKQFPIGAVLSLATGKMLSTFDEIWQVADFIAGRPLMSHNFASQAIADQLRDRLIAQVSWLAGAVENCPDFSAVSCGETEAACKAWVAQVADRVGTTVVLAEPAEPIDMSFMSGLEHLGAARNQGTGRG